MGQLSNLWFNSRSIKWSLYACNAFNGYGFKKIFTVHRLTWKGKINVAYKIIAALCFIHDNKAIHRDLHSGKDFHLKSFESGIYSVGILMWEISSRQTSFNNYEHNYDLAVNIMNDMRSKIISNTPSEYYSHNDNKIDETDKFNPLGYDNSSQINSLSTNKPSKLYQFENLPEPRNATEEEQEAFHSKPYDFNIPDCIDE
ncbi:hypothetical protein C1645_822539 [Glomus cerebriforme]|uniref:Protein kinase domain-containing protein n=1 Tax=Glomus cerebriforme TaxID=658196 RepID=A0A397T2D4_9GLOM|nr:hypothetical protein C1645_822539 [Glomus cerebriforme]